MTIRPVENIYIERLSEGAAAIAFALWIYLDYSKRIELKETFIQYRRNKISLSSISKCVKERVCSTVISNKEIEDDLNEVSIEYVIYNKEDKVVLRIPASYYFQESNNLAVFMDYLKFANILLKDDN